jgi:CIC family chloride channel protein
MNPVRKKRKSSVKARPFISTCLYGLVASLAAVGFQLLINWMFAWCYKAQAAAGFWRFATVSLGVIVTSSLIVGWLLHSFCPEAAGSGIPQVKLTFWKEFGSGPRRISLVKFVAGVISIGGGQSLGREGPTVQIGSSLATSLAQALGVAKQSRRSASAAGAAAGLAAAFNAPLAAVAFVLEEIIGDLNSRSLGSVLLASVIGAFVVHACIGPQPAFELPHIDEPTWRAYLLMPIAAALAALAGAFFHRAALSLRGRARLLRWLPGWLHPLAGGIGTWIIGIAIFSWTGRLGVFGLGYDDLSDALAHGMAWKLAALLLAGKLLATILAYGLGGCGGIFSPNLFFGAMCGCITAGIASQFLSINQSDQLLLTVGGMSACLGAVVQAPVTGILIIFEMTHQFALVPGLMLAGLVSHFIATRFHAENFYDEVLSQDGHQMEHLMPPRDLRSWHGMPVSVIATFKPVILEELSDATLAKVLRDHPYRHFPVVFNGLLQGICTRTEIEAALAGHRPPELGKAMTCRPSDSIGDVQHILVDSATGLALLTGTDNGAVLAIVTLHDLLRAQIAMSEREGNS